MPNYPKIWNAILPKTDLPQGIFSISQDAINTVLKAHRLYDTDLYHRKVDLTDTATKKTYFSMDMYVGAKNTTPPAKATPLAIKLYDTKADLSTDRQGYTLAYEYPERYEAKFIGINPSPNVMLGANNINMYLSWPKTGGGSWKRAVENVNFTMEAYIDIETVDAATVGSDDEKPQTVLKIVPISLYVSQVDLLRIEEAVSEGMTKSLAQAGQVNDLLISLIVFAATQIGPDLTQSIPLPVAEIGGFDVYPSFMVVKSETITVGASLEPSEATRKRSNRIAAQVARYEVLLEQDVAAAGGWDNVLFTADSLKRFYALPEELQYKGASRLDLRKDSEITATLARSQQLAGELNTEIEALTSQLADAAAAHKNGKSPKALAKAAQGMSVAISEHFLNSLISDFGEVSKSGSTKTIKVLDAVKGNLGYKFYIGQPSIKVLRSGLSGSAALDAWAGLNYAYREIHRCSKSWSKWKRVGVGVRGVPQIKITTRISSGVSILASVNLKNVSLYTGVKLLDKLLKGLSRYFFAPLQGFVNAILALLSFVVLPAEFSAAKMKTAVAISDVKTTQYKLTGGPTGPINNFMRIEASVNGKKA